MAGKILEAAKPSETATAATGPVEAPAETKAERFKRLANKRVGVALDKLRLVSQLSARGNYEYTEEQVAKIVAVLRDEIDLLERQFQPKTATRERCFEL